jgi:hypothetical protein
MIPYVDVLIDRCSSNAPFRAASECMRAWPGQLQIHRRETKLTLLTMIPPRLWATKIIGRLVVCQSQNRLSTPNHALSHICTPSLEAEIRHQLPCMIVEILAADAVAMSVRIVSPAKDTRVGYVSRQEGAKPLDIVGRRPSLVSVSVQPMDGNNAGNSQGELLTV